MSINPFEPSATYMYMSHSQTCFSVYGHSEGVIYKQRVTPDLVFPHPTNTDWHPSQVRSEGF